MSTINLSTQKSQESEKKKASLNIAELRQKVYNDTKKIYGVAIEKFTSSNFFKFFFVLSILFAISEPILIAFGSEGAFLNAQIAVIVCSTVLYFVGLYFTYTLITSGPFYEKIELLFSRETIGEGVCLAVGWIFIFIAPPVAALRCFRVFRLLWYLSQDPKTKSPEYRPEEHWVSIRQTCNLCVSYLQRLGEELFSAKSRGGLVVISLFFYTTYIFAVVFHNFDPELDTHKGQLCRNLTLCYCTLLRLSFYDEIGFAYLEGVIHHGSGALAALLFGYMLFTALMLLNGLIGIFGHAFELSDYVHHKIDQHRRERNVIHNAFSLKQLNDGMTSVRNSQQQQQQQQQRDGSVTILRTSQPLTPRTDSSDDLTALNSGHTSLFSNASTHAESPIIVNRQSYGVYKYNQENTGAGTGAALEEYLHQLSTQLVYLNKSVVTQMKLIELVSHKIEAIETHLHHESN